MCSVGRSRGAGSGWGVENRHLEGTKPRLLCHEGVLPGTHTRRLNNPKGTCPFSRRLQRRSQSCPPVLPLSTVPLQEPYWVGKVLWFGLYSGRFEIRRLSEKTAVVVSPCTFERRSLEGTVSSWFQTSETRSSGATPPRQEAARSPLSLPLLFRPPRAAGGPGVIPSGEGLAGALGFSFRPLVTPDAKHLRG